MTQNPFEGLGGEGGFDMNSLLEQAQQMQQQLAEAQEKLANTVFDGTVGGSVTATVNGVGELTDVRIDPAAVEGTDADSLSDLGDMIVAAYREAKHQADQAAAESLGPLAGGDPGGMGGLGEAGPGQGGPGQGGPGQLGF